MLVIGHRGASAAAPENSIRAFEFADKMGADGVELDVRLAPDGRLIVKHDPLPTEPAALDGYPVLSEALAACGNMLVNVEIKNSGGEACYDPDVAVAAPTIAEMREHGDASRWIISSFDWATIRRCRELAPELMTAYLVMNATPEVIEQTAAAGHAAVHPWEPTIDQEMVDRCHGAGIAINTWTCNDPERLQELARVGVDAVCTDMPDLALMALGRRISPAAQWGTRA
ncbi:glycerophosphodiester phosphodiesterase [uncultured Ilumatobacter sp.]|jgi:glycerophosphoryl diester phosphodiesterase|uniref:glycerophosphodiester phosphodiesterase n=1 Tax=uncultured Ilumatobacter sp. TaxID=879968 RepID=UPI00374E449A